MSSKGLARRTELVVAIHGIDVSENINKYLLSASYTDNESDKTDDLRIELDDRGGWWLEWMKDAQPPIVVTPPPAPNGNFRVGDMVQFKGGLHHHTSMGDARGGNRRAGPARVTFTAPNARFPVHLNGGWGQNRLGIPGDSNVYGWVLPSQIEPIGGGNTGVARRFIRPDLKGARITARIIQRNFESDGRDRELNCGEFEIDSISAGGPPARVTIRATSLPHKSTVRTQLKTRAWENLRLSGISGEIARVNGLSAMFSSGFDPLYGRKEQIQSSDIVFLEGLCYNAGIALKVTDNNIVLFDEHEFERKAAIGTIRHGESNIVTYRFSTNLNDTVYGRSHVIYADPVSGETIEYLFTPNDSDPEAPTLEINEKVNDRNEARNLAMRRLRQKNKQQYQAGFTLAGDVRFVAGATSDISGWGVFDGKHIIQQGIHNVTASGYTTQLNLRRVLEGY